MLRKLNYIHWTILAFLVTDIIFVILHFTYGQQVTYFNIDLERNIPTFYQGFKLVIVSSIIAGILTTGYITNNKSRFSQILLIPYWIGFMYLALDEVGEIHENFGGFINKLGGDSVTGYREFFVSLGFNSAQWLLFFIPIIIIAVGYLIYLAQYFKKQKVGKIYVFIIALICFSLVPVIEYWNTSNISYTYSFDQRNILVVLEEYFEMLGATLFLTFNLFLLYSKTSKARELATPNSKA